MANKIGEAFVEVRMDPEANFARRTVESSKEMAGKSAQSFKERFRKSLGSDHTISTALGTTIGTALGRGISNGIARTTHFIGQTIKDSVSGAVDVQEAIKRTDTVFGSASKGVEKFAATADRSLGLSKAQALGLADSFGGVFHAAGVLPPLAAKLSPALVQVARDLSTLNQVPIENVFNALRTGLIGRPIGLRRFGVDLSSTAIAAEAVSSGLVQARVSASELAPVQEKLTIAIAKNRIAIRDHGAQSVQAKEAALAQKSAEKDLEAVFKGHLPTLTAAQHAQAAYALIIRQSEFAAGTFQSRINDLTEKILVNQATTSNLKAELGKGLVPALTSIVGIANDDLIPALKDTAHFIKDNVPAATTLGKALLGVGAAAFLINKAVKAGEGIRAAYLTITFAQTRANLGLAASARAAAAAEAEESVAAAGAGRVGLLAAAPFGILGLAIGAAAIGIKKIIDAEDSNRLRESLKGIGEVGRTTFDTLTAGEKDFVAGAGKSGVGVKDLGKLIDAFAKKNHDIKVNIDINTRFFGATSAALGGDTERKVLQGQKGAQERFIADQKKTAPDTAKKILTPLQEAMRVAALNAGHVTTDSLVKGINDRKQKLIDALQGLKDEAKSLADSISTSLTASANLVNISNIKELKGGPGGITTFLSSKLAQLKLFAADLIKLKTQGLSPAIIQQIAEAGVDQGLPIAQQIIGASTAQIARINALQNQIQVAAGKAGATTAEAVFGPRIQKAIEALGHDLPDHVGKAVAKAITHLRVELDGKVVGKIIDGQQGKKSAAAGRAV